MNESTAQLVVTIAAVYASIGVVGALSFLLLGLRRIDQSANGSSWGFAAVIFPGLVALWPVMLVRWALAKGRAT